MQKFAGWAGVELFCRPTRFLKLAAWGCAAMLLATAGAHAQTAPLNDNFTNAIVISGTSGSTTGNNAGATLQSAEAGTILTTDNGTVKVGESVWFQWTALTTGNVTFDTIGSVDVNFNPMDTVLGVWTGSSFNSLLLNAANDNAASTVNSSVTILATAGVTYYIAIYVNTSGTGQPGNYTLNWNEQAAPEGGMFRLTSANYTYSLKDNGSGPLSGVMSAIAARATVTRVGGASGKAHVAYTLSGGTYTNLLTTNIYTTNIMVSLVDSNGVALGFTNYTYEILNAKESYENYTPANGYFYTSRLSSALLGVTNANGIISGSYTNGLYFVTNAPFGNQTVVTATSMTGGTNTSTTTISGYPMVPATNIVIVKNADLSVTTTTTTYNWTNIYVTNIVSSVPGFTFPAGGILTFNDFEMNQDISIPFIGSGMTVANLANPIIYVNLTSCYLDAGEDQSIPAPTLQAGRTESSVILLNNYGVPGVFGIDALTNNVVNFEKSTIRCNKSVNGSMVAQIGVTITGSTALARTAYYRIDYAGQNDNYDGFTLQPGSDYARPDVASEFTSTSDFTSVSGEITWPVNDATPKFIQIPITQDNIVKFNQDLQVELYIPPGTDPASLNDIYGNLTTCSLTILYTTPPAGSCDTTYNADNNSGTSPPYNQNPGANGVVYAAVVQPTDGKTVIGGDFSSYNNPTTANQNHIARINVNGQLDTTFNIGYGFDADVEALALDANQNIIAVGEFGSYNHTLSKGIARISPSGALDTTFNTGQGANGTIWTTAIQPNGQILIAGDFSTFNNTNRSYIARLNPDGSVDSSFDPGIGPNADIYSMAVQTNGQIVIGGAFTTVDGTNLNYIARLNADGTLDTTFNPGYGFGANNIVNSVVLQPNGQILVGGSFTHIGNIGGEGIDRLNTDGSVDTSFYTGIGANDEVNTINLQADGTILIGGWFTSFNQTRRIGLARLLPNGELDTSFMDTAYNQFAGVVNNFYDPSVNPPNPIYTLAVQGDGNVIIGGSFSQVGGGAARDDVHPRQNEARLNGGSTPGPGNVELSYTSYAAQSSSPFFYVQVDRTNGSLGSVGATVSAIPTGAGTGYAAYGVDYTYTLTSPVWGVTWADIVPLNNNQNGGDTWRLSDGLFGTNNYEQDITGNTTWFGLNPVSINIISNNNNSVSLNLAMTQPKGMDTFFLGGAQAGSTSQSGVANVATVEGENIPLGVALGVTLAPLTIVHNNPHDGVFNFSPTYYYISEGQANVVLTVTRTAGTDNKVSVQYSTSDGTAKANTHYVPEIGKTLSFNQGQASSTITIPLKSVPTLSTDVLFSVTLSNPGGGASLGTLTNSTVEIVADNFQAGHLEFAFGNISSGGTPTISYGTNENSGPLQVTVARLGGAVGLLSVNVVTSDGSATNGTNYRGVNTILTWTNNDASPKTVYIPVLDDGVVTSNLTATVSLLNPTVNNVSAPQALGNIYTNATLVVSNIDSPGTVQFTSSSYTVNENAGYAIIPVYRTGGAIGALNVNYATGNGTATAGYNFMGTNGTLTFAPGQVSTNFIVWLINQNTPYGTPLNFQLTLSSPSSSAILGSPIVAQVNVNGSQALNAPPGQTDSTYSPSAGFNASVFALALQANGQLLAGGDFTTADGVPRNRVARLNADGSLDSTFSSYLSTYGANSTVRALAVQDNGLILMGGFFTNYNSSVVNYIARLNVDGTVDSSFNIGAGADNPVYTVASTYANGARVTLLGGAFTMINGHSLNSIARLLDNGTVDSSFSVGQGPNATVYAMAVQPDGKIVIGGDFTAVNGTNLNHIARLNANGTVDTSFNPGLGANNSVHSIALQLDGGILIGGLFTNVNNVALNHVARLLSNGSVDPSFNVGVGANGSVESIAVQSDTRIVLGGNFTGCNGVTRNRITRLNPDGTVDPTINFGTGADSFVAASVIESSGKIDIGGGFQNYDGAPHPYLARINGGSLAGSGAIQFSSASYQVDEKGTNVLISFVRTGGTSGTNAIGTGDIYVPFSTSNGSAVAGLNYTAVTTNIDFPAGEVMESVLIPVFDDGVVTTNLTVGLTITNPTLPAVVGVIPSATLYIINDDSSVSFSSATYSVAKNTPGGVAVIGLTRHGSQAGATTVNFTTTTTTGTAIVGTDYTPVSQLLTFNPGVSNITVTIPINNNGLSEPNQTVGLQLFGSSGSSLVNPTNATLTIINTVNLPGQFAFSATNYTVTEGGGSGVSEVLVTVVRTNGTAGEVQVSYTTVDGTALSGVKYIATNNILTFNDGVSAQSFYVQVYNTTTAEGPEYLGLALSGASDGAGYANPTNATVTILNTNTGIAFVSATNSFTEPFGQIPGSVVLNVIRFNNTNGTTTVNYSTADGTATAGVNYGGITNATLTFNPGDSIKPITVSTLYDPLVTGDLTFTVGLFNPSAGAQLTLPSVTTVIDHDVNNGISFYTNADSVYKNAGQEIVFVICSNTNDEPASVNYATGGGTAVPGVDYTATSGTLVITNVALAPGRGTIGYGYFYVPIIPNDLVQSNKTFNITLSGPTGTGVVVPPAVETVTIVNTNTPYGLSFSSPITLSGDWGSTNANNSLGSPEPGDPYIAGNFPTAPVWFVWTAPASGEVTLDTIGSLDSLGLKMDTLLAVYTGSSLANLNQVAANDDLYPNFPATQENDQNQNIYNTNSVTNLLFGVSGPTYQPVQSTVIQPYSGPSALRFNAQAGVTYYIEADSKASYQVVQTGPNTYNLVKTGAGNIALNWAYHSSGVFRFATEMVDQTLNGTNGNPLLMYQCADTESEQPSATLGPGTYNADELDTVFANTYYDPNVAGLLVTVTRVAGSTGRVSVDYMATNCPAGMITNGDLVAVTNIDFTPVSGTLIFDDYEMSKSFVVPISPNGLNSFTFNGGTITLNGASQTPEQNRDFQVLLSNPQRDPQESGEVSAPRVDPVFGTVLCRILSSQIDPKGPATISTVTTNFNPFLGTNVVTTNLTLSFIPTNAVFNFSKANYRIPRDEANWFNGRGSNGVPITIYVNRFGTNDSAVTLHWRLDAPFLDKDSPDDSETRFPLAAGSDYAVPTPPNADAVFGTNSDFAGVGGDSGTLSFPAKNNQVNQGPSQKIQFTLNNNYLPSFNRDVRISIYGTDSKGNPLQVGMINETTVTILFNDEVAPAGSVDQLYNPDLAANLAFPTNIGYLGSTTINPGADPDGEVYSLIVLPTNSVATGNQSIIAGALSSYTDGNGTHQLYGIARLNSDGSLDTTFNTSSGVNVFPGGEFIRAMVLTTNNQIVVGGDFDNFRGSQRNSIARLNPDGTLDSTFNPGSGFNGTVWALAQQADGRIIAGGDFTTYNGIPAKYVVRINTDGTLDPTFNSGTNLNAAVYSLALENNNAIVAGGAFTLAGGPGGQNRIVRLNSDGSLDTTFNTITGPNAAVRALAIQPDGKILAGGEFTLVAGQAENYIVRFNADGSLDTSFNSGTGTDGTVFSINDNVVTNADGSTSSSIYVGGSFTVFNGTHRLGFTRLYGDGTVDTTFLDTAYNQFAGLPRIFYNDPRGTVYASGIQADGNILITGSFQEVGGGQAEKDVRNNLESGRGLTPSFGDRNLWVSEGGTSIEAKSRDGVRYRCNVARLVGGVTAGPGNIGMSLPTYSVNKTAGSETVNMVRTNGSLGYASANFAIVPGLAKSGSDFVYSNAAPVYPIEWEYVGPTRDHYDGLYGPDGQMNDKYGRLYKFPFPGPATVDFAILNDTASAGNLDAKLQLANPIDADQFYLGGENIPVGVALGESVAPLSLLDTATQDGVLGFANPNYVATNSPAIISILRTNGNSGTVQVSYKTVASSSTAVNGVDYQATNNTVTFNPGSSSSETNLFPVIVLQNSSTASTEKTVALQLYNVQDLSGGDASLGVTNAVLRIINPNFNGYLNLTTNIYSANLSAGFISFAVSRTVGSKGTLSVQYATANGTASNNVDYVGTTNSLSWSSGDVSPRIVTIPLLANSSVGIAKQFSVSIFNPTLNTSNWPSLLGATTNATLNINNNNSYGTFQFSTSQYRVNDNGGYATITVARSGSALGSAQVAYTTADASAIAGLNYVPASGILAFAPMQLSASFNVQIKPDTQPEPAPANFYFDVVLTNASAGAALGALTNATVNIVDSQTLNLPPGSIDTSFNPNLIVNGSVLALALQSDGQIVAGGAFTAVNGANLGHIARLNTDGSLDTSFLLGTGAAGANGNVNALVSQTDDRILIGGSFTSLNGQTLNNVARLMTDGTWDNSFNPGAGADNSVFALAETFINGSRELYVGGAFSTFNGVSSPGIVRVDNYGKHDASFATGSGANGTVYAIAAYPTNAVYDNGSVLVGGGFANFNNVPAGNIVRLNENGSVDTNFNVSANGTVRAIAIQADGSILIGGDFTVVNGASANHLARLTNGVAGTVGLDTVFAANSNPGVSGTVDSIAVQSDGRIIVAGQFIQANGLNRNNLTRLLPSGSVDPTINFGDGANGAVNAVVVQPTDGFLVIGGAFTSFEDQPLEYIARIYGGSVTGSGQFSFNSANYQIDENGGFATVTVSRSGGSSGPNADGSGNILVNFATSNGTAVDGVNYLGITNTLTFPPGQTFQTINIPVLDDQVVTPNLTVNLTLTNPTMPAGLGDQASSVLTIINDDSGVSFAAAGYSVPKNTVTGVANISVVRLGSTSGSASVTFETDTNGTAVIGTDYYPTNETIFFAPGDSQETVQVPIINNNLPEGPRTVGMLLTNVSTGTVLSSPTNATLTIIDTVNAPGQLYFATNSYTFLKANANAYLTVLRTNGSSGSITVNYYTVAGTATPGLNYVPSTSGSSLTLGDGVTSGTIAIPLVDNSLVQGTVSFSVNLANPSAGSLVNPTNTTINIVDHNVGVSFQSATNYAIETSASAVVFVQRIGATNTAFSVNYATTNITALSGTNYTAVAGTLNFAAGQSLEGISIPLIDDHLVTGDLLFGVNLSNASNGTQLVAPTNALVVIHDADAGISFTNANTSVLKSAGSATITVVCSNPAVEPVVVNSNTVPLEVNYYTTNGTATAGVDYTAVSGTLVFTNGNGTNTFTVPIINNSTLTGNRTFNVVLAQPTAPGQLIAPSTETVTIIDVNSGVQFSSPTYTVLKTGIAATINVNRTGFTNSIVAVNYATANGTAVSNVNYTPVSGTLTFTNGVTSQSFTVPIISSTVVQPDLTVFLQLSAATNAALTYPSFATLTIEDLSGSLVVPAGAVIVEPEGFSPPNGIIDPGETDTLRFGFRASSGTNVANLIATLLATNGIGSPSGPQTYGPLVVGGPVVSRPFTFTANGTNGQSIVATFKLMDGAKNIGTNTFTFNLGTWSASYSNTAPIIINDFTTASPYPSTINVSGLAGVILKTTVTLTNLDHSSPADIEALVVAPNQQDTLIMANAGAGNSIKNVTLNFDDAATNKLTQFGQIVSGTNKPTAYPTVNSFP